MHFSLLAMIFILSYPSISFLFIYFPSRNIRLESETATCKRLQVAVRFGPHHMQWQDHLPGRDCLPVAMVLITSWKQCIQAVKMKMAPDVIHTLILLWKSAQVLTWSRTWVVQFAKKTTAASDGMRRLSSQHARCIVMKWLLSFYHSLAFLSITRKRNKYIFLLDFQSVHACLRSSSCNITKRVRQTALIVPYQATPNYSWANTAVQTWHYTRHLNHFTAKGLLHCWAGPPIISIRCLLCSLPRQRMCCSLTGNIQVHWSLAAIVTGIKTDISWD